MIVCIPSKGRPETSTYKIFEDAGYDVYHFIEPQEMDAYKNVPNRINIGESDKGVTYVRNFMLQWCKGKKIDWSWFCDDDVIGFGIYNGKTVRKGAEVLQKAEKKAMQLPFEIVGLSYVQYAWTEKKSYSINTKFAEVCALMHVSAIDWEYNENTKEDRDFAMQTIQKGHGILRFNHIRFSCPNVGSNEGGLHEWYATNKDHDAAKKMALSWNPWVTLKQKGDRLDIKTDIKGFAKSCMRKVI